VIKHVFFAAAILFSSQAAMAAAPVNTADQQLVARGAYLAKAGDCIACHTSLGGKPFAGGLAMATPIGTLYSTNITPDKVHGIGSYTEHDFDQALRHGVRKDGTSLYPAMPYPSYAKLLPADVSALYAYFMRGVPAEPTPNRATDISWPLSMRWPLRLWRGAFAPDVALAPAAGQSGAAGSVQRGRYLVEGLGHCGACHTPRAVSMQEKALIDDGSAYLSGGLVDGYLASSLRGDAKDGLGMWTEQDIVTFLKSGRNGHSASFGGMADVIKNSTQFMTDDDLHAMARYLKTLKSVRPAEAKLAYNAQTHEALRTGKDMSSAALTYLNNCAACHRSSGKGYDQTFPALALSPTINADDPGSLISIVLQGAKMPGTASAPTEFAMPAFSKRMTDQDVAEVLTFVRRSWGNNAPAVTASMVAKVRKAIPKEGVAAGTAPAPQR
jgi:mono/diheme cytochrome c family protein